MVKANYNQIHDNAHNENCLFNSVSQHPDGQEAMCIRFLSTDVTMYEQLTNDPQ